MGFEPTRGAPIGLAGRRLNRSAKVALLGGGGAGGRPKRRSHKTTPVGFEPTRGDPIGLAGRRLNRSAKVSVGGASRCCAANPDRPTCGQCGVELFICRSAISQLGERQTEDLKVPGSILGLGTFH